MKTYQVTATRVFHENGYARTVQIPTFQIEASSRVQANLMLGTILHTTLTETHVSFEEIADHGEDDDYCQEPTTTGRSAF